MFEKKTDKLIVLGVDGFDPRLAKYFDDVKEFTILTSKLIIFCKSRKLRSDRYDLLSNSKSFFAVRG